MFNERTNDSSFVWELLLCFFSYYHTRPIKSSLQGYPLNLKKVNFWSWNAVVGEFTSLVFRPKLQNWPGSIVKLLKLFYAAFFTIGSTLAALDFNIGFHKIDPVRTYLLHVILVLFKAKCDFYLSEGLTAFYEYCKTTRNWIKRAETQMVSLGRLTRVEYSQGVFRPVHMNGTYIP